MLWSVILTSMRLFFAASSFQFLAAFLAESLSTQFFEGKLGDPAEQQLLAVHALLSTFVLIFLLELHVLLQLL